MKTVHIFKGKGLIQPWRIRVVASNGKVVSDGGEGYFSKWNAKRAARKNFPDLPIKVVEK